MREITTHKVNGLNEALEVLAVDEAGSGGASHHYLIAIRDQVPHRAEFFFQDGPIGEVGVNGLSNESLLAVVIDRLQGFQKGPFACRENALALTKLEESMHWLHSRTRERVQRGVEGTLNK